MSGAWIGGLNGTAALWAGAMLRACWQGGIALVLAWVLARAWPGLPPWARCWLWRLAYLKLLLALFWATPVSVPLLPAPATAASTAPGIPLRPLSDAGTMGTPRLTPSPPSSRLAVTAGLMLLWVLGAAASTARFGHGWKQTRSALAGCVPVSSEPLGTYRDRLCRRLGIRRMPPLLLAAGIGSPLLVGIMRPAIVLPAPELADWVPAELELMVSHELAHLKRQDLLWAWLPTFAHALFWFHPLVWLAGLEVRLAQEMACDQMAVQITRAAPPAYAELLLKVAAQSRPQRAGGLITVGVLESYHTLRRRLTAMTSIKPVSSRQFALIAAGLLALGALGLVPWRVTAQPSSSQKAGPDEPGPESMARLKQLGLALRMYAQDYDEVLPPMRTPPAVKKVLLPYVRKQEAVFLDPYTDEPYQPNGSLSGKAVGTVTRFVRGPNGKQGQRIVVTRADVQRPWEVAAFYEPTPAPDGTRGIVFLDGHVARLSAAEWPRVKRASGIR